VSMVDAGTMELVRGMGVEVLTSADLIQHFEARWSADALASHLEAGQRVDEIRRSAFEMIGEVVQTGQQVSEYEVQQFIRTAFEDAGLFTDHGPIVGVNANASNPHYEPSAQGSAAIKDGDFVLIDMWAKLKALFITTSPGPVCAAGSRPWKCRTSSRLFATPGMRRSIE
jgi:Xaa-Pro dipeptidase